TPRPAAWILSSPPPCATAYEKKGGRSRPFFTSDADRYWNLQSALMPSTSTLLLTTSSPPILLNRCHSARRPRLRLKSYCAPNPKVTPALFFFALPPGPSALSS